MAVNINNIGEPQYANVVFVPLALAAGIENLIKSLVPLAIDRRQLLILLVEALQDINPPLAAALNTQTLEAIMAVIAADPDAVVVPVDKLPATVNEDGPASVSAARDASVTSQVNISFPAPPQGGGYVIAVNEQPLKRVEVYTGGGDWVNEAIQGVPEAAEVHVRVLYLTADGAMTNFGPLAKVEKVAKEAAAEAAKG